MHISGGKNELFIGLSNCKIKLCFILKSASLGILNLQQWNRRLCPQLFKYQTVIHIRYHTFLAYCITIKMYMYMKHVKLNWKWNICSSKKTTCTFLTRMRHNYCPIAIKHVGEQPRAWAWRPGTVRLLTTSDLNSRALLMRDFHICTGN